MVDISKGFGANSSQFGSSFDIDTKMLDQSTHSCKQAAKE